MNKWVFVALSLGLTACSGGGGSSAASKSLFSVWTRTNPAPVLILDMRTATIGTQQIAWTVSDGHKCTSDLTLSGDQYSGSYSVANSAYVAGTGTPASDPGCSSLNEVGTYKLSGNDLVICTNGTVCGDYE